MYTVVLVLCTVPHLSVQTPSGLGIYAVSVHVYGESSRLSARLPRFPG
jgi:hypothetical protein